MRSLVLTALASLTLGTALDAQETELNFSSLTSYVLSIPSGQTRDFVTAPSWFGMSWEGIWKTGRSTSAGVAVAVHDFSDETSGTTYFEWGAVTGQQMRSLTVASAMATGRWYPLVDRTRRLHLGLGAGVTYFDQTYRLGVSETSHAAGHLAIAPEAGWQFALVRGIDGVVSARYTIPASASGYLGGSRRYPFATLSFGILER